MAQECQQSNRAQGARAPRDPARAERPAAAQSVFRSSKQIYAQIIDDEKGATVAAASSLEKAIARGV